MAEVRLSGAKRRLLALLRSAPEPLTLVVLSQQTGSHVNTLRGHLDSLIRMGLVEAVPLDKAATVGRGRGRPALRYRALGVRHADHAAFLEALASEVGRLSTGDDIANRAGRLAADNLVGWDEAAPDGEGLLDVMEELGFDPEQTRDGMMMRSCPVGPVMGHVPNVVCQMHLAVAQRVGGVAVLGMDPAEGPGGTCLMRLSDSASEQDPNDAGEDEFSNA